MNIVAVAGTASSRPSNDDDAMMRVGSFTPTEVELSLPAEQEPEALDIARLKRGEASALADVYRRYHTKLRAFAQRFLGDSAAAEDLVHDVFVALPGSVARFRGEGSLEGFLFSIAINISRHHVRSAIRRRAAMAKLAVIPTKDSGDPERDTSRRQLAGALQRALDQLSHEHRATFVLCEVEGRAAAEVASILGAPEATIRTRVFYAKRKLRELLTAGGHT
ncbi:RNA polymerase sigma factor [Pendulispora rubella]|uniref:RNA polymerase sigma factor n=1 Tax=Pendulispora rubella TaxID=2741070 RepID=A0ABZ2KZK2_9BACT